MNKIFLSETTVWNSLGPFKHIMLHKCTLCLCHPVKCITVLMLFCCCLFVCRCLLFFPGALFFITLFLSLKVVFIPLFVSSVCVCVCTHMCVHAFWQSQSGRKPGAFCTVSNQNWSFSSAGKTSLIIKSQAIRTWRTPSSANLQAIPYHQPLTDQRFSKNAKPPTTIPQKGQTCTEG